MDSLHKEMARCIRKIDPRSLFSVEILQIWIAMLRLAGVQGKAESVFCGIFGWYYNESVTSRCGSEYRFDKYLFFWIADLESAGASLADVANYLESNSSWILA